MTRESPRASAVAQVPAIAVPRTLDVLVLIDHLVLGGAESLVAKYAEAAPRVGIRPAVACLAELDGNPAAAPLRELGIEPTNLDLPGRPSFGKLHRVRRFIAARQPDIVHTHLGDADLLGGLASRSLALPVVSTLHTMVWERHAQARARRLLQGWYADRVIAVSETARAAYADSGRVRAGQLVTIHNGIDVAAEPGAGAVIRRELGWGEDDHVIGMVSALRIEKAHDVAVAAFEEIVRHDPTARLLIVGQGLQFDRIATACKKFGHRAALVGRRENVMAYFDAFDVCLHPSRVDAFPTTLIEAMAASVPIVATAVGGIPEIVEDGRTGVLVPVPPRVESVRDAVIGLLDDPAHRRLLAANALSTYKARFTADPWIRAIRALYDDVLSERGIAER